MANVLIKSDERKNFEGLILRDFKGNPNDNLAREAAECIAARVNEAHNIMRKQEEHRK